MNFVLIHVCPKAHIISLGLPWDLSPDWLRDYDDHSSLGLLPQPILCPSLPCSVPSFCWVWPTGGDWRGRKEAKAFISPSHSTLLWFLQWLLIKWPHFHGSSVYLPGTSSTIPTLALLGLEVVTAVHYHWSMGVPPKFVGSLNPAHTSAESPHSTLLR